MPTISSPLSSQQIQQVRVFLAPEPEGRGYFDNFVIENPLGQTWGLLGSEGHLQGQTTARRLFDVWQLVATVLPEVAGVNRNHILFEAHQPLSETALPPQALQMSRRVFYEIAEQLMDVVRSLDARIPLVSNGSLFLEILPRLTDQEAQEAGR